MLYDHVLIRPRVDGLRKDELVSVLDEHLQTNATRLSRNADLRDYYDRTGSPAKRVPSNVGAAATVTSDGEIHSVVRQRGRRTTKVKDEFELYVKSCCRQLIGPQTDLYSAANLRLPPQSGCLLHVFLVRTCRRAQRMLRL